MPGARDLLDGLPLRAERARPARRRRRTPIRQARLLDWPQAFADQGAGVYVANTGYGYGDTEIVAYSEKLMALFAERSSAAEH